MGRKTIKWWKYSGDTAIAYKGKLVLDYDKLGTTIGREEEEWKVFKLLLLAKQRSCVTEEGSSSRRWTEEKASGERVMEDDIRD